MSRKSLQILLKEEVEIGKFFFKHINKYRFFKEGTTEELPIGDIFGQYIDLFHKLDFLLLRIKGCKLEIFTLVRFKLYFDSWQQ